ncbi:forkhead domain-containing protein [Colletotrichum tofieldiae]|nr:forkhead domain-containing protein [Colletotrichum tofieldiae]
MNQTGWVIPKSTFIEGLDNEKNDNNQNYCNHCRSVPTGCSASPLSQTIWPPDSTHTSFTAVAAYHHLPLHPQGQPPVSGGLNSQMSMPANDLCMEVLYAPVHYNDDTLQHSLGQHQLESERLERPLEGKLHLVEFQSATEASDPSYSGPLASFPSRFMTKPDVLPKLSQQTLPDTSAPFQKNIYNGEPYAKLIHLALKNATNNSMTLQELYWWFEKYTDKPKKTEGNGWRNSIRHNLSVNEVSSPGSDGCKPGTKKGVPIWFLHRSYIDTVKPTTTFRKGKHDTSRRIRSRHKAVPSGDNDRQDNPPCSRTASHYQNPASPSRTRPRRAVSGGRGGRKITMAASEKFHRQPHDANECSSHYHSQDTMDHYDDSGSTSSMASAYPVTNSSRASGNTRSSMTFMSTWSSRPSQS